MQARIEEHTSDDHLKMCFVEFLEAIARAAEYLNLGPPSDHTKEYYKTFLNSEEKKNVLKTKDLLKKEINNSIILDPLSEELEDENLSEGDECAFLSQDELIHQPLHKKIENLIPYLLAF